MYDDAYERSRSVDDDKDDKGELEMNGALGYGLYLKGCNGQSAAWPNDRKWK